MALPAPRVAARSDLVLPAAGVDVGLVLTADLMSSMTCNPNPSSSVSIGGCAAAPLGRSTCLHHDGRSPAERVDGAAAKPRHHQHPRPAISAHGTVTFRVVTSVQPDGSVAVNVIRYVPD